MAERAQWQNPFDLGMRKSRAARIAEASERLADVLETIDVEREPALADAVVDALVATDTAYALETKRDDIHLSDAAWSVQPRPMAPERSDSAVPGRKDG